MSRLRGVPSLPGVLLRRPWSTLAAPPPAFNLEPRATPRRLRTAGRARVLHRHAGRAPPALQNLDDRNGSGRRRSRRKVQQTSSTAPTPTTPGQQPDPVQLHHRPDLHRWPPK
uniref:(northern house mosquito) hypothetical protein n=1 Tax=Culex pipiens TaxID=7175 RepID=A0A8D7ZUN1_CULPI